MTELQSLLADISRAVGAGDMRAALRLADRAGRISGDPDTICLLRSRLLIQTSRFDQALRATANRDTPALLVVRGEAFCHLGAFEEAGEICQALLANYCVGAVDGLPQLASRLCRLSPSTLPGWVGVDAATQLVGEVRIGTPITTSAGEPGVRWDGADDEDWIGLTFAPPEGFNGALRVLSSGLPLLGSGLQWPPLFHPGGWIAVDGPDICGEARVEWAPGEPVQLAVMDDRLGAYRVTLPSLDPSGDPTPFSLPLAWASTGASQQSVAIVLPSGALAPLSGSPALLPDPDRVAEDLAENQPDNPRSRVDGSVGRVDIIVPVYAGYDETMACLDSLLATATQAEAEIVVIDDASPEPRLSDALATLARNGCITLLTNSANLGFPATANRGMALHPDRDVVVLNADTEVYGDWISRLKQAAYSAEDIASVTPLASAGSITNYLSRTDRPCSAREAETFDEIARVANAGEVVELPVGVGFCLYLRRACLEDVGLFDAAAFGRGYGEENDLCLRASERGWRHVAAPNVFVRHVGGRSFGNEKALLMARNRRVLNNRHPGFDALVERFVEADPLREHRRAIDAERFRRQSQHPVVILTAALPGGVARSVEERQRELAASGCEILVIRPVGHKAGEQGIVLSHSREYFGSLVFDLPSELDAVLGLLAALRPAKIEAHHFLGHDPTLLDQLLRPPADYDVYVHDYAWICPRLTLLGGDGSYCGEPAVERCEACVTDHGSMLSEAISVAELRERSARLFAGAKRILAPTEDCRARLARYFPEAPITVRPLEAPAAARRAPRARGGVTRIGVIGAISVQKGYHVLLDCARHAAAEALALEFVLFGYSSDDNTLIESGKVFVTGLYGESELEELLDREECHAFFFPSVTPETWCYSLTSALSRGAPVVAFDIGAIAERLRARGVGVLLPLRTPAEDINTTLLKAAQQQSDASFHNPGLDFKPPRPEESIMDQTSETDQGALESSAQLLPLPAGLYAFKVSDAADPPAEQGLLVPAVQVGLAPIQRSGAVEFLASPNVSAGWLSRKGETIVAKVGAGGATLLLTSLQLPDGPALAIDVQRVDGQDADEPGSDTDVPRAGPDVGVQAKEPDERAAIPVRILAHVSGHGDVAFLDRGWAGVLGQQAWIEAFSVLPQQGFTGGRLEYRAVGLEGGETDWVSEGQVCGSRGQHQGLVAFAFRLADRNAGAFECRYQGRFLSGAEVGPMSEAEPCRSPVPDDPLEALMVWIAERALPIEAQTALEDQSRQAAQ